MEEPIFVRIPRAAGDHLVRLDRIINIYQSELESIESIVVIERWEEGKLYSVELYSSASIIEISTIIQNALSNG